ncbi:hypothetical protein U9M48_015405 [Paspalum notatum var. saurae]|uniref:Uncharacterized protein n=1 Tax=Paspalum notatum var. saurae TaxID=547442 RepID=A0AAQ3WLT2_PASNO
MHALVNHLVLLLATGTGEHGPDGKHCAICALRSLHWIQLWIVANLAVPLVPTLFLFCLVPVLAYFAIQLMRQVAGGIYQPSGAQKAVAL